MRHQMLPGSVLRRCLEAVGGNRAALRQATVVMVTAALIANAPPAMNVRAQQAHGHELYHDEFYRYLKIPGTDTPCCDGRDCRPAQFKVTPTGVQFLINARWISPPPGRIIQTRTPDGGGHWCGIAFEGVRPHTYCAIIPPTGS